MPDAPVLSDWIGESSLAVETLAESLAGPSSLTIAELRVLQLLPTHLSFWEMADGLHVTATTSRPTRAVCRKLDACSRLEALVRAREAGLLGDQTGGLWTHDPAVPETATAYPDSLTLAELRVLQLLPSELSFAEGGSRLRVSARTVKV